MKAYEIRFTKEATKDIRKLTPLLRRKLQEILLADIAVAPYSGKRLVGDLWGYYSVRLTFKDRIVYSVDEKHRMVYVHRARTHYGE